MKGKFKVFVARCIAAPLLVSAAGCRHSKQELPASASLPAEADGGVAASPAPAPSTREQRIAATRQLVEQDPRNVKAWIALGDEYFDSRQREKAVEAYGKALELQPDNPDVLTDQGIMYRELGAYDKAKANFEKASTIDPKHTSCILDLGVLYARDLKDEEKAIKMWNRVIEIAPASPQAAKAREYLEQLKHPPKPK
jgi:tetratricopeptide (TPR) repeat protein